MSIYKHIRDNEDVLTKENLLNIVHLLSDSIGDHLDKDEKCHLKRKVWGIISDGHYNKEFAEADVAKMYIFENNSKTFGPFYSLEETTEVYNKLKKSNPILVNYNEYDFYVVMNMIKSDNYVLYKKRFSGYNNAALNELFIEDSINWLDDLDNPYGTSKIWKYINS